MSDNSYNIKEPLLADQGFERIEWAFIQKQICKLHNLDMIKFNLVCVMFHYAKF